jgi:bacteriorhodopsin
VPLLLLQLVIVRGLAAAAAQRLGILFSGAGAAMIILGYIGQFHETSNLTALWIWDTVNTVFYAILLYLTWTQIGKALPRMSDSAAGMMKSIRWIFLIFWTFYPIAYIMPAILPTAEGVVARQYLFTIADIVAEVTYGVLITKVAVDLSRAEGFDPASSEGSTGSAG